jgi:hypothetical protein
MATAVALTIGLCLATPRGRWLFTMFCGLTIMQRLQSGSHFFSDVVGGAAFGLLWSYFCVHPKLLGSLFDKLEAGDEAPRRTEVIAPTLTISAMTPENELTESRKAA